MAAVTPDDVVLSADPANWTPHVRDGRVLAIAQVGDTVVVGGEFTEVKEPGGDVLARTNIFAFDALTGKIDQSFVPALDREVEALVAAPDGQAVFVGGRFKHVNGVASKGLTKLDVASGARVTDFRGKPNRAVFDLAVVGDRLVVGGNFDRVNSTARLVLAALDVTTGALDPDLDLAFAEPRSTSHTTGSLNVQDLAATPDGSRLVVAGNFSRVDGQERHQLAVVDLSSSPASLANWSTERYKPLCPSPKWPAYLRDVDVSPDGTWFAIVTTGAYSASDLCDTTARWELGVSGAGLQPTWVDYTGGDTLFSVAVTGSGVYIGGHQRWQNNPFAGDKAGPGAVPRSGIAALDIVNGLPLSWNPGRKPRGMGVFALVPTAAGLWVGSDTAWLAGEYHARVAFLPAAGGTAIPPAEPGVLPGDLHRAGPDDVLTRQTFDGAEAGDATVVDDTAVEWSRVRGAFMLSGNLYTGWDDGKLYVRDFDGTALGSPSAVELYGLTSSHFPIAQATGMFFDPDRGRLYYTVDGDARLFFRQFTPESQVVGAQTFVASGNGDGFDWGDVEGITLASGHLYFARADGNLRSVEFTDGTPDPGTETLIDGPATGGRNWASNGLFIFSPAPAGDYVFSGFGSSTGDSWHVHDFAVSAPQTLRVRLDWDDPTANLNLFLLDPSGTTVAAANGTAKPEVVEYEATEVGTWSIGIKIKSGAANYEAVVNPPG